MNNDIEIKQEDSNLRPAGLLKPQNVIEYVANLPALETSSKNSNIPATLEVDESLTSDDLEEESDQSYEEGLMAGIEAASDAPDSEIAKVDQDSVLEKRENTRSTLAIVFTLATFGVFVIAMIISVIDGLNRNVSIIDNIAQIIPIISGVFLGSLGFVLGYYFRKGDE